MHDALLIDRKSIMCFFFKIPSYTMYTYVSLSSCLHFVQPNTSHDVSSLRLDKICNLSYVEKYSVKNESFQINT